MSNNDLYCSYCKTQHHPVECPKEEEDKMNTTQKDIEVLKAELKKAHRPDKEPSKFQLAIAGAIQTLEAVEKSKGVLPEKRISEKYPSVYLSTGFNACLDLCTPVVAKLIKENKELREGLESNFQKGRRIEIEKLQGIAKAQAKKIKELEVVLKLLNDMAKQRFQWERNPEEDNKGWLKISEITAQALEAKLKEKL